MKKRSLMMNLTIPDAMPSISIIVKRKGTNDGEDKGTAENAAVINNIEYEGWKDEDNLEKVNQLSVAESVNQNFENGDYTLQANSPCIDAGIADINALVYGWTGFE